MNVIAPLLITLAGIAILSGAETEHDDHAGHDHGTAPAATAPAKKKPHVHGAHGEEEGEDEHGHDEPGHTEGSGEVSLSAAAAARFGIVSEPAKARAVAAVIRAPGWIVYDPAGQAQIATPAAGRVVAVHVQAGSAVKTGDPLIDILSPAFVEAQSGYLIKQAAATAARYYLETALATLARGRQSGDGISGAELQRREADAKQAEVAKRSADAELSAALSTVRLLGAKAADLEALKSSGTIVETLVLRAPIAGTVVECSALPGQQIAADAPPLLAIADTTRLWVVANVPEAQVAAVTVGSLAELYAFNGNRIGDGDIAAVTPDIDPHTRSGRARLAIAGTPAIRPGMYVQVHITPLEAESGPLVVAVPEGAVMSINGRSLVFIAEPAGADVHFRAQPVITGQAVGGYLPILSGLEAGTPVVVQGAFLLKADLGKEGAEHDH